MLKKSTSIMLLLLSCIPIVANSTPITYTYFGNIPDTFYQSSYANNPYDGATPYGVSSRITGYLTFSTALSPNQLNNAIQDYVLDWKFTDGFHTYSEAMGQVITYSKLWTDSEGNIDYWYLLIEGYRPNVGVGDQMLLMNIIYTIQQPTFPAIGPEQYSSNNLCVSVLTPIGCVGTSQLYSMSVNEPGSWSKVPEPNTLLLMVTVLSFVFMGKLRTTSHGIS